MIKSIPIITVDFKVQFDNISAGIRSQARICIDNEAIQNGLIAKVGVNRFSLLLIVLSHMDKDGKVYLSQRRLAELSGLSVNTVNKLINELIELEVDGQKLLSRKLIGSGLRIKTM